MIILSRTLTNEARINDKMLKVVVVLLSIAAVVYSKSVVVGQVYDYTGTVRKVYEKQVEATGIPLIKREEEVLFEYPIGDQKIKGIAIQDLDNGLAEPSITRGGLGFNFVNIKLKSERGSGYRFNIVVYA